MNIIKTGIKTVLLALGVGLFIGVAMPQTALAAGETYEWQGDTIVAKDGVFEAGNLEPPPPIVFNKATLQEINQPTRYVAAQEIPAPLTDACTINYAIKADGESGTISSSISEGVGGFLCDFFPNPTWPPTIKITGAAPGTPGNNSAADDLCNSDPGELNFLVCPIIELTAATAQRLDCIVIRTLIIDTDPIFGGDQGTLDNDPTVLRCLANAGSVIDPTTPTGGNDVTSDAFRTAWGVFRNIAYALVVVFGLIMVISQILSLDLLDAYTIRKMLPKLILAVIFIALSWNIMNFLFSASNDGAFAVMDLIKGPFRHINASDGTGIGDIIGLSFFIPIILSVGVAVGVGLIAVLGIGGVAAVIVSILLGVFTAFVLLAARNVVADLLIISSPLWILAGAFEPFKKLFSLGRGLTTTILISVPAVAAVIEMTHVGALVAYTGSSGLATLTAVVILISGYAMIWGIFKKLDQVTGQLGNIASGVTGKLQKRLADYRNNTFKQRWNEGMDGKRTFGGVGGVAGNSLARFGNRVRLSQQPGAGLMSSIFTKQGRIRFEEAEKKHRSEIVKKAMEHDADYSGGDDDVQRLLMRGYAGEEFIRAHADMQMHNAEPGTLTRHDAEENARKALAAAESSFGVQAGTDVMRAAAYNSYNKSNTAYRYATDRTGKRQFYYEPQTDADGNVQLDAAGQPVMVRKAVEMDYKQMAREYMGDAAELVKAHVMTSADATKGAKANGARAERAGLGWGTTQGTIDDVAARGVDAVLTEEKLNAMADEVLLGTNPQQLWLQRHEAARILAPEILRRTRSVAERSGGKITREFVEQVAQAASLQDMAGGSPALNASLVAQNFMGQQVAGATMQQWLDFFRNPSPSQDDPLYTRIYDQQVQQIQTRDGNPGALALPNQEDEARDAAGKVIQDAQKVLQQYRREYSAPWMGAQGPQGEQGG